MQICHYQNYVSSKPKLNMYGVVSQIGGCFVKFTVVTRLNEKIILLSLRLLLLCQVC